MQVSLIRPNELRDTQLADWNAWVDAAPLTRNPCVRPGLALAADAVLDRARVLVIEDGGRDVAYMPLDVVRNRGWPVGREINDGDGMVVRPGIRMDMARVMRAVPLWSLHWGHRDDLDDPLAPFDTRKRQAARVSLADGVEAWERAAKSIIKQSERKARKLEREVGPVRFELEAGPDLLEVAARQKADQLAAAGQPVVEDPQVSRLLGRGLFDVDERGRVRPLVSVLRAGDQVAAVAFGLHDGRMHVLSMPTVDLSLGSYSPGVILQVELLRQITTLGVHEVDLGVGINQAKERLSTHMVEVGEGMVFGGRVSRGLWDAKELARSALRRLRS